MFVDYFDIFWLVIILMYVGNIVLLIFNLFLILYIFKLLVVLCIVLLLMILFFFITGVYLVLFNIMDVYVMILVVMGVIVLCLVNFLFVFFLFGFILGGLMEENLCCVLIIMDGEISFLWECLIILVFIVLVIVIFFSLLFGCLMECKKCLIGVKLLYWLKFIFCKKISMLFCGGVFLYFVMICLLFLE